MQLIVDPENGARPTGMKEGLWAESEASGWRKAEPKVSGRNSRQDQVGGWMGGVCGKAVKKAESAGELVTKAESADEER